MYHRLWLQWEAVLSLSWGRTSRSRRQIDFVPSEGEVPLPSFLAAWLHTPHSSCANLLQTTCFFLVSPQKCCSHHSPHKHSCLPLCLSEQNPGRSLRRWRESLVLLNVCWRLENSPSVQDNWSIRLLLILQSLAVLSLGFLPCGYCFLLTCPSLYYHIGPFPALSNHLLIISLVLWFKKKSQLHGAGYELKLISNCAISVVANLII